MRVGVTLAILMAMTSTAFAGGGFEIVIPGRPGVPVIINGVDASYAVVEGDWGLGKRIHVQPTVYGGRYIDPVPQCRPLLSERGPNAGLWTSRNRTAGQPPIAAAGRELSSIMVGAVGAAAGAVQRAGRSAGDHLCAAGSRPARFQAASTAAPSTLEPDPEKWAPVFRKDHAQTKKPKNERQREHLQERVMRHLISGLVAAVAVMATAPAMACGYTPCGAPQVYVAPVADYGCNPCGGWAHERLADPEQQYYYVNQGPTYTGPGDWAPVRTYRRRLGLRLWLRLWPWSPLRLPAALWLSPALRLPALWHVCAARHATITPPRMLSPRLRAVSLRSPRAAPLLLIRNRSEGFQRPFASSERAFSYLHTTSGRAGWRRYRAPAPRRSRRSGS